MMVAGLSRGQWHSLAKRVRGGFATDEDAKAVERIGLGEIAARVRCGMATALDAQRIEESACRRGWLLAKAMESS